MKHVLSVIAVMAVTAFWIWLKWSQAKSRVRDLANGGIQTIFDKDSK
jgi:hypothetical protein